MLHRYCAQKPQWWEFPHDIYYNTTHSWFFCFSIILYKEYISQWSLFFFYFFKKSNDIISMENSTKNYSVWKASIISSMRSTSFTMAILHQKTSKEIQLCLELCMNLCLPSKILLFLYIKIVRQMTIGTIFKAFVTSY